MLAILCFYYYKSLNLGSIQIAADVTTSADAFPAFAFIVEDQGTLDGLPTNITRMRLVPGANNTADWTDHIQGVRIAMSDVVFPPTPVIQSPAVTISDSEILLDFSPAISIPDGGMKGFGVGIYLNTNDIVDGSVLQFQIDAASSGFTAESTSSGFADPFTLGDVVGSNHTIDVDATQLTYLQQPTNGFINEVITPAIQVAYTDSNGNVDVDYEGTGFDITLTTSGSFAAAATTTVEAIAGVVTFSNLVFDALATGINLTAIDDSTFISGTFNSDAFDVLEELIVIALEDFDDTNPKWPNNISSQTFVDPSDSTEGLFIQASTNIGSGNTLYGNDLGGETGEPTLSPYTFTFENVNVQSFTNLELSFDYYAFANADVGNYEIFVDGIGQGSVEFYNDPETTPVQGTISESIGTANTISLVLNGTLNGSGDIIEFDNFKIEGNYNGDLIYSAGAWSPNAPSSSTGTDNALVQDGTYISSGDISLNAIIVLGGASVEISPSDVLTINESISNNGTFTFKSDENGSAQLADATGATIAGDITVERYISNRRAFRLLSSSVNSTESIRANWQEGATAWDDNPNAGFGTHITGLSPNPSTNADLTNDGVNGFDWSPSGASSLFVYNINGWEAIENTDVNLLSAGAAYRLFVRGNRSTDITNNEATSSETTLRSTGGILIGSYSPTLNSGENQFSFIGNPYQAVVDYNAGDKSGLTNFIYVWDASIGGNDSRGLYVAVELPTGSNEVVAPGIGSSDASQFIAPGQSFFVHNSSAGNSSITFEEADKATTGSEVTVFSTYTNFYINSRLYKTTDLQNGQTESDAIGLRFNENFTTIATEEDAVKYENPGLNYAIVNDGLRSIDKQDLPVHGHQIELAVFNYEESEYTFTFDLANVPDNIKVYLIDAYTNAQTELETNTTYGFTVEASIPASSAFSRFKLIFEQVSLSQTEFTANNFMIYPNPVEDKLNINISAELVNEPVQVDVFDMLGRRMIQQEVVFSDNETQQIDATSLNTGIYLVHMTFNNKTYTHRIIKM